jgi:hypothetical protein
MYYSINKIFINIWIICSLKYMYFIIF